MNEDVVPLGELLPWFRTLEGYRKMGGYFVAKCPTHNDGVPSLSLSARGVLRCHAGCSFSSLMEAKRKAFPDGEAPRRVMTKRQAVWTTTARYSYTTIDGKVTATKTRQESDELRANGKPVKRFFWNIDSDGRIPSDHGLAVEDFGLWVDPAMAAAELPQRVFLTEGEKACEAVRVRSEFACCPPGSASNVPPKEALEPLRGWDVIIWRDLDGAGLRWAEQMKRALRYIAKSVRIVVAPGEEGDDAVEFFAGGGQLEDLLSVSKAITERLSDDHFRVTMPSDYGGPVVFDADEMYHLVNHGKSELNAVMRVTLALPGTEEESYVERINMYSSSSKSTFIGALANQFDGDRKSWTRTVNSAFERIDAEYKAKARAATFTFDPERPAREFLVETLFPFGHHSIVFAPPAVGKSYQLQKIALCVAMGMPFAGLAVKQGPVLILDYESERVDWEERWERLLPADGYDPEFMAELPIRHMKGDGIPLYEQWRMVKREAEAIGAIAIIVDSAMPAVGGDMFSPTTTSNYFAALNRIGLTSITIGQVPAADMEKLYGNQQWIYAPHGRNWNLTKQQQPGTAGDDMQIAWTCKKSSNGRWPEPFAINIHFDGERGPVVFDRLDIRDVPAFAHEMQDEDRIENWLRMAKRPSPIHEIALETELPVERVRDALGKHQRFIRLEMPGSPQKWALRAG